MEVLYYSALNAVMQLKYMTECLISTRDCHICEVTMFLFFNLVRNEGGKWRDWKEGHWHFGYIHDVFVAFVISINDDMSV